MIKIIKAAFITGMIVAFFMFGWTLAVPIFIFYVVYLCLSEQ